MMRNSCNRFETRFQKREEIVGMGKNQGGTVLVREREFVGENIEAAVDLHGIGVDEFDGEVGGQING